MTVSEKPNFRQDARDKFFAENFGLPEPASQLPAASVKSEGFLAGALQGACAVRQSADCEDHPERGKPRRQEIVRRPPVQLQQVGSPGGQHHRPAHRQDQAEVVTAH